MGGGKKDIYFHLNFHLIGRTHSNLNSLSKLGFEKYPSYHIAMKWLKLISTELG
jgi:hypothetical protein